MQLRIHLIKDDKIEDIFDRDSEKLLGLWHSINLAQLSLDNSFNAHKFKFGSNSNFIALYGTHHVLIADMNYEEGSDSKPFLLEPVFMLGPATAQQRYILDL